MTSGGHSFLFGRLKKCLLLTPGDDHNSKYIRLTSAMISATMKIIPTGHLNTAVINKCCWKSDYTKLYV